MPAAWALVTMYASGSKASSAFTWPAKCGRLEINALAPHDIRDQEIQPRLLHNARSSGPRSRRW